MDSTTVVPPKKAQAASMAANIAIFSLTILIGLVCVEGLLRIKNADQKNYTIEMWRYSRLLKVRSENPILGHEHQPNKSAKLQGVEISLNSLGMRSPEVGAKTEAKRILFLGSSNTLGWGVPVGETLTARLQAKLGSGYEVLNAGVGNYNAERAITLLETKLVKLKPDIVVLHYFVNDAEKLEVGGGNFFLRHSQVAVLVHHLITVAKMGPSDIASLANHYQEVYKDSSKGFQAMTAALKRLEQLSKEAGFEVVFSMVPDIHQSKPYPFGFVHKKMQAVTKELGWTFVDFSPVLQSVPAETLWAMPGDPHINGTGHAMMAETLYPELK